MHRAAIVPEYKVVYFPLVRINKFLVSRAFNHYLISQDIFAGLIVNAYDGGQIKRFNQPLKSSIWPLQ